MRVPHWPKWLHPLWMPPSVGIVIATRDRRSTLLRTLERLKRLPEHPGIVVVDNGSRDHTAAAVRQRYPDVDLHRLPADVGASARSIGVDALDTELVAFNDDDSWWAPGALDRAARLFAAHPRLGLLAAQIRVGPDERLDPTCAEMARSPLPAEPGAPGRPVLGFVACGAVVRRSAFLEAGGFRGHRIGGEEHLLALDLASAGWALAYVDEVVAHHVPPRSGPGNGRRHAELESAFVATWLRRRPLTALGHTIRLLRQPDSGRDRWGALLTALEQVPWIIRNRRALPWRIERTLALLPGPGVRA